MNGILPIASDIRRLWSRFAAFAMNCVTHCVANHVANHVANRLAASVTYRMPHPCCPAGAAMARRTAPAAFGKAVLGKAVLGKAAFGKAAFGLSVVAMFVVAMPATRESLLAAELCVVEDGQPRAEIVIADNANRSTRLAAQELQDGLQRISGAKLPIVTVPAEGRIRIFVGRSPHTDALRLSIDDLRDGAYRIVSRDRWLALLGIDTEFAPIEPWAKNNSEIVDGAALRQWRDSTRSLWNLPNLLIYKDRMSIPGDTGLPDAARTAAKLPPMAIWAQDERGSFNAVCGYLQRLGARWYAPGDLGTVLPSLPTIPLEPLDETVRPDFPIRRFNLRFGVHGDAMARWAMRLGVRDPYGVETAHGMDTITDNPETFAAHPEWFAMAGGKRRYQRGANNHLCYSNEELIGETVRYVRAVLDRYKLEMVSVMPPDGYTSICQCDLCQGKDSPEREQQGLASDYIWGFVNRVAQEVRKTHPDKKVLNCAYGIYSLPPLKIDKLEPNVVVSVVGGRRPMSNKPEQLADCRQLRESWLPKTSHPIIIFENYPLTDRGWYLPAFTPHALGASINATKGLSQGEDIWLSILQEFEKERGLGLNHFMVYFTQRMYWGGKNADVDALYREYAQRFYGPAGDEMKAFFDYCESHWQEMEKQKDHADTALALFDRAKAKVEASSLYGQRVGLIDEYLRGLRNKSAQLGKLRGPLPVMRLVGPPAGKIVVDGKLDDDGWVHCPLAATVRLSELQTGRKPVFGTVAKAAWLGNDLYFAIRCEERLGEPPVSGTTRKDDSALWNGDAIEVHLETESRSYYQIAVGPGGAMCDLDRAVEPAKWFSWDSKAEVATHIAADHWSVEIRLPIRPDDNDPLNQIVGHHPTRSLPWNINICRQRIRDDGAEYSAFSPTGIDGFHNPRKLATFYDGNSYKFEHGPADDDFLEALRRIDAAARAGKRDEALSECLAAADRPCTDLQKSHVLELAAAYARGLKKPELAEPLLTRIPIPAARSAATMRHWLDTFKAAEVVAKFGSTDIASWPFWKRGEGYLSRGTAYLIVKSRENAEADLIAALPWLSDSFSRDNALLALAQNREFNFQDDTKALEHYTAIVAERRAIGAANEFTALQGIARIQTRRGQFDAALQTLNRAQPDKLEGVWRTNIQKSIDAVKEARAKP